VKHHDLNRLRSLDPEQGRRPAPAAPDDPALLAILAAPPTGPAPAVPQRSLRFHGFRPVRLVPVVAVAGALAIGFAVLGQWPGSDAETAFASWTPQPATTVSPDVRAWAADCATAMSEDILSDGKEPLTETPVLKLVDQRGDYVIGLATAGPQYRYCISQIDGADGLVAGHADEGIAAGEVPPGGVKVETTLDGAIGDLWTNDGLATIAVGRADAGVDSVLAKLADGTAVQATVAEGWWAVWVPGDKAFDSVDVIEAAGQTTAVAVEVPLPPVITLDGDRYEEFGEALPLDGVTSAEGAEAEQGPPQAAYTNVCLEDVKSVYLGGQSGHDDGEQRPADLYLSFSAFGYDWALGGDGSAIRWCANDAPETEEEKYVPMSGYAWNDHFARELAPGEASIEDTRHGVDENSWTNPWISPAISIAVGRTGKDAVTGASITAEDGTVVKATVANGWWMVAFPARTDQVTIDFTWADGAKTSEPVHLSSTGGPKPDTETSSPEPNASPPPAPSPTDFAGTGEGTDYEDFATQVLRH